MKQQQEPTAVITGVSGTHTRAVSPLLTLSHDVLLGPGGGQDHGNPEPEAQERSCDSDKRRPKE